VDAIIATNTPLLDPNTARLSVISRGSCKKNKSGGASSRSELRINS
jgi:hypothetical protein